MSNGKKVRVYIESVQDEIDASKRLWYVLVVYSGKEIVSVQFVRSDKLPQKEKPYQMSW